MSILVRYKYKYKLCNESTTQLHTVVQQKGKYSLFWKFKNVLIGMLTFDFLYLITYITELKCSMLNTCKTDCIIVFSFLCMSSKYTVKKYKCKFEEFLNHH